MWKNEIINPQFIFHADFIQELPEKIAHEWIMYILHYGLCGVEPVFNDIIYSELWRKIKERIDFNKRSYERKCEYQREYKQRKAAEKGVIQNIPNNSEHSETFGIIQNIPLELHSNTNTNTNSNSKFKSNSKSNTNTNTNTDVCDKRDYFLSLWNKNADVLGIAQAIERPNDFNAYFDNESVTKETIEKGITHFVEAVKSGKLQKRFIPATPDRFILKNTLERFQEPMADKSKSVIYDADHRGEFQEVEQA